MRYKVICLLGNLTVMNIGGRLYLLCIVDIGKGVE